MTPITDLIPQYEQDATRLEAHLEDLKKRYHAAYGNPTESLRLTKKIEVAEQEYYEIMADIRAMKKYEKKG